MIEHSPTEYIILLSTNHIVPKYVSKCVDKYEQQKL